MYTSFKYFCICLLIFDHNNGVVEQNITICQYFLQRFAYICLHFVPYSPCVGVMYSTLPCSSAAVVIAESQKIAYLWVRPWREVAWLCESNLKWAVADMRCCCGREWKPIKPPTAVSAARWNVELLQWEMVFKSPFCIQKLWKAEIWTEYSYDLVLYPIWFSVA